MSGKSSSECLYQFSIAPITKPHKIRSLNNTHILISLFWRSKIQNGSYWTKVKELEGLCSSLEALGKDVPLLSPAFRSHPCSFTSGPQSPFSEAHAVSFLCAFLLWSHLSLAHFAFPFLLLRGLVITFHTFDQSRITSLSQSQLICNTNFNCNLISL